MKNAVIALEAHWISGDMSVCPNPENIFIALKVHCNGGLKSVHLHCEDSKFKVSKLIIQFHN